MSATPNNGVRVGSLCVLVQPTGRRRNFVEMARDLAASLLLQSDVESNDWLVTVHEIDSGRVLASRRFDDRGRAERARALVVERAEDADDLDAFDWELALAGS